MTAGAQPSVDVMIRAIGPGDEAVFERIAPGVFEQPIDSAHLAAVLRLPGHHLVVALHDGTVVGQVAAIVHGHVDRPADLYIDEVAVAPAFHRLGIARRMIAAMLAIGRSAGCEEAWVTTELDNAPARRLYATHHTEADIVAMYLFDLATE